MTPHDTATLVAAVKSGLNDRTFVFDPTELVAVVEAMVREAATT